LLNSNESLSPNAKWLMAIADDSLSEICERWKPKGMLVRSHKVATFGSCFAQILGPWLKEKNYTWFDAEPAPDIFVRAIKDKYNYGIFSARTGTINSVAALRQWVSWAIGVETPSDKIWEVKDRFFDPFRPSIEPNGFATREELLTSRRVVLRAIRDIAERADWFVFTLGQSFAEVSSDLNWVIEAISTINKRIRFVLTVAAIPLTATESVQHVLTPTPKSKSYLCGVARSMAEKRASVDYFPSYEIITAPLFQAMFYNRNKQVLSRLGAKFVINCFFASFERDMSSVTELEGSANASVIEVEGSANASDSSGDQAKEFWSRVRMTRNSLRDLI
jgi:hypothetical protein